MTKRGISGSNLIFVIWREIDELPSREVVQIYKVYIPTAAHKSICFPTPHQEVCHQTSGPLPEWKGHLSVDLICNSLILSVLEHLFICLIYSIFMNCLFVSFAHFNIGLLVFFLSMCRCFLCMREISSLWCELQMFPSVCLLILFTVGFAMWKFCIFL